MIPSYTKEKGSRTGTFKMVVTEMAHKRVHTLYSEIRGDNIGNEGFKGKKDSDNFNGCFALF